MGFFDWLKNLTASSAGIEALEPQPADSDTVAWLKKKGRSYQAPSSVTGLAPGDAAPALNALMTAVAPSLERQLQAGTNPMLFGMAIPEEEYPAVQERVIPALDATLQQWIALIEEAHGEPGLAFIALQARNCGYPFDRAKPLAVTESWEFKPMPAPAPLTPHAAGEHRAYYEAEKRDNAVVAARIYTDWDGPDTDELLTGLLTENAGELQRLTLGLWNGDGENQYESALELLQEHPPSELEELFIGDYEFPDETEISWTTVGDVEPLWALLPALKSLRVRGGGIRLGAIEHNALEELVVETGGLPLDCVESIAAIRAPKLKKLEVWFGDEGYGAEGSIQDLLPLFSNRYTPAITQLGLKNAEFSDDIARSIVSTGLCKQLTVLDLSLGTLSDQGAAALVQHAGAFPALETLDVSRNYLSSAAFVTLSEAFGEALVFVDQDEPDEDGDELHYYVSVGE